MSRLRLFALWISTGVSCTATSAAFVAIPWFVLMTTGSAARVGLVTAVELVGLLASAAVSGPVIDRIGPRRVAASCDLLAGATLAFIPLLQASSLLRFWALVLLAFAFGAVREPGQTSRRMVVPELVADAGVSLERGAGGNDAAFRAGQLLGAPMAGAALAVSDSAGALWLSVIALSFGAVLVFCALWTYGVGTGETTRTGYFREMIEGYSFVAGDRLIAGVIVLLFVLNMLDMALLAVIVPVYSAEVLHSPVALGAITGTLGGAALLGNLIYTWIGHRAPSRRILFVAAISACAVPVRLALIAQFPLGPTLLVFAVAGLASGAINPILAVVAYERIPENMRGRVLSLTTVVAQGGTPIGVLFGGLAVEGIGRTPTLWISAVMCLLVTVAPMVFPSWRGMNRPRVARGRIDRDGTAGTDVAPALQVGRGDPD